MSSPYREHPPGPLLHPRVECLWTSNSGFAPRPYRVFPDGCMDFLYSRANGRSRLDVIGAMTRFQDFHLAPGALLLAVRFRPGGLHRVLGPDPALWNDSAVELASINPREARAIKQRLDDALTPAQFAQAITPLLARAPEPDPVQLALACLESSKGLANLEWLASQANLSERQFRRLCLARTGLPPKQLSRILRFRHALSRLGSASLTGVALDCGYYDQAHFIHDFRQWTGRSPSEMSDSYNRR
ncbi:MAG: AraC family transcriptional regulator [Bryobacterales bacterium]|nr:AraC family transcriptional regulator [Bryobacterales bacterium]